jgi:glycine cleavage system H lipoate-binding protein/CheY-like chemotaxis protein
LVQRRNYDFVFTDLKMPGMDGVEVVKAVRHLRPDTDLAVITGYATIESAVETMQHGACAYVQKPFTPEELTAFVRKLVIQRQARAEAQALPAVRVVAPAMAEAVAGRDFCVPGGAFLADGHTWARVEPEGQVRVGLDDFSRKALGTLHGVDLPAEGQVVQCGEVLFAVRRGDGVVRFVAPVSGRVARVNATLRSEPALLGESPYDRGWVCLLEPSDLAGDLAGLRIGRPVIAWYQEEIARLRRAGGPAAGGAPSVDWSTLEREFFGPAAAARGRSGVRSGG